MRIRPLLLIAAATVVLSAWIGGIAYAAGLLRLPLDQPFCNLRGVSMSDDAGLRIPHRSASSSSPELTFKFVVSFVCRQSSGPENVKIWVAIPEGTTDSIYTGRVEVLKLTRVHAVGSHARRGSPMVIGTGDCKGSPTDIAGCTIWFMLEDNGDGSQTATPDVFSFVITDGRNRPLAYGAAPVMLGGNIRVF